jgi:hypothetical protein
VEAAQGLSHWNQLPANSGDVAVLEMGQDERRAGDVADLAWPRRGRSRSPTTPSDERPAPAWATTYGYWLREFEVFARASRLTG